MFRKKRLAAAVTLATSTMIAGNAYSEIEEVIVTATKRAESTQDIAVAVSAVNENTLEELGISTFEDYLLQLPGVTAGGSGPGQNTIYIRGVASTTPNLTTAGVAGLAPNVAFYLDEQPLSQPGRNLDVYAADMNRVEVLSGPQGTLFGSSSQAGTVRLITNKPDPGENYASVDFGTAFTQDGEMSNNVEAMANFAFSDALTLRGVVYVDNQGGYIDNVPGTLDVSESARFRAQGTVRANGVPVSAGRAGFQAGSDLSGVNFVQADNSALAEEDFNDTTYSGARLSGLWDINEDWSLLVSHSRQTIESDGVFFADPNLSDLEVERFSNDEIEDEFHNTSWTLEGRFAELEVVYTGAYTERETDQTVDYSDYLFVGQYLPYYVCDGSVSYPGAGVDPTGTCQAPNLFVKSATETDVVTHEIRISTDASKRIRGTFGAFYSDLELTELNDFTYPGSTQAVLFGQTGFSDNFAFTSGYRSSDAAFPAGVIFRNDVRRTDEQTGVFGEVNFDLTDQLTLTLGARYYDIEVDFDGSANSSFCNGFQADANAFGTDISDLYNGDGQITFRNSCDTSTHITYTAATVDATTPAIVVGALQAPDVAQTDGTIFKVTASYAPTDSQLWYATASEGFRPGLLNRPGGRTGPNGFVVPFALDTDDVTNLELGWKLDLLDYSLRFNGSLFFVDIENLQTTIFDPSIVNLFFSDNAADAEVRGIEGDFIWVPASSDNWTITGAFSILDTEITKVITPTNDVIDGDELAFAPEFQGNLRARYEWPLDSGLTAHVMPHITYSAESFSDIITINRDEMDSWVMVGFTAGVTAEQWSAEFYADNLNDERAEISRSFVFDAERVTYARPRTMGVRVSYDF